MSFIQLSPEKWNFNVFNAIKNWMVLTAGTPSNCNSMIVSWGALGILWNKPTASVYVRESRYTLPFMQEEDYFTLSILPMTYETDMKYLGSHSGRNENKYAKTNLHPISVGPAIGIEEANYIMVIKKQLVTKLDFCNYYDKEIYEQWYSHKDKNNDHYMFMGEIINIFKRI